MILLTMKQWQEEGSFSQEQLDKAYYSDSGFIGYCKKFAGAKCFLWQYIEKEP